MHFSAVQSNVDNIISRNCSYLIPKNQRKYVWDKNEWDELFSDIFEIPQDDGYTHFIGSFVLSKAKKQNEYYIVDGQQRLITISILLCCIVSFFFDLGETSNGQSILKPYLCGMKDGEEYYKVTREDGTFYLTFLVDELKSNQSVTSECAASIFSKQFPKRDKYNQQLLNCYQHFKNKIDHFFSTHPDKTPVELLQEMKGKLTSCECIEIIVDSDVEGIRVFETLNARGIPLEQHELIKNYLYSYLRSTEKVKNLDEKWRIIINNISDGNKDNLPGFITHYCAHRFGDLKKNEEYRTIRNKVQKNQVEDLLTSLCKCSVYYSYLVNPEKYRLEKNNDKDNYSYSVYVSLRYFHKFGIRQVRPLILSLFEAYQEKGIIDLKKFEKALALLENFYFTYVSVLKERTNKIDQSIVKLAVEIHDASERIDVCNLIKEKLSSFVSEKDKIKDEFLTIGYSNKNPKFKNSSNKKIVDYIFEKIEKHYDCHDELPDVKIASIEHIYNDSVTDDFASNIGNLLPFSKKLNEKAGNKDFIEKKEDYKKSNMLCVKEFLQKFGENDTWGKDEIEIRGRSLAKIAFNEIWKF